MADDKLPPDDKPADKPTDQKPADKPAPPPTVPQVKNTPLKYPAVIALEKKVSELEDKNDSITESLNNVLASLEDLKIGGPSPVLPKTKGKADTTPAAGGMFDDLDKFIWGN